MVNSDSDKPRISSGKLVVIVPEVTIRHPSSTAISNPNLESSPLEAEVASGVGKNTEY